jgi:hypothetical protein
MGKRGIPGLAAIGAGCNFFSIPSCDLAIMGEQSGGVYFRFQGPRLCGSQGEYCDEEQQAGSVDHWCPLSLVNDYLP